jgi:adenosylhomocysteine nucleosidase
MGLDSMDGRLGIIGAMDEEIELYLEQMKGVQEKQRARLTYYIGRFLDNAVVVCKSGVGKVNASVCTQIMIDDFDVSSVIFTGVAGGVDPELNIGDIVISSDCLQHDIDASALGTLGFKRGQIPFADTSVFVADQKLVDLARQSGQQLGDVKVKTGRVLSGDQFIADRTEVENLYRLFQGACVEMEGAAVGHVCHLNEVPFVIIRSLSDKADGSAHVNFLEFTKLASKHSFQIVYGMLKAL